MEVFFAHGVHAVKHHSVHVTAVSWSGGRSSGKCQKVPVSSFSPVSAAPAKWSYSCAKEKCV